jgi:2-C-methyl-D-erythritol 2,4-cyclodiphosphate synthase
MNVRSGCGFDAHRFGDGRRLMLGGIEIAGTRGLEGHSDADVLLHALADALLGAAALGDIGMHFPDSDPQWKGTPSRKFVEYARQELGQAGWEISNVDLTVIAQSPKIAPFRTAIRRSVAEILELADDQVSLKATTTDHMGFIGREEGIAAQALVTIYKK